MSNADLQQWATYWTPPRPKEMHPLRSVLAEQMRSPTELRFTASVLAEGKGSLVPRASTPTESAQLLLDEEHQRLKDAELYWVSAEMTDESYEAGSMLKDFQLAEHDLPSPAGFVVWQHPIGSYVSQDTSGMGPSRAFIVAATWGHTHLNLFGPHARSTHGGGVWVTFWSATNFDDQAELLAQMGGISKREALKEARTLRAELTWDNETFLVFTGHDDVIELPPGPADADDEHATLAPWVQTLRATWLLMTQPGMTETKSEVASRKARRRAAQDGYTTSPDVQVIQLRGENIDEADTQTKHASGGRGPLTMRERVRGHWKHVAYGPGRAYRRPTWISAHTRGPEGAPMRRKSDRVYRLG